jgi:DNA-binding response OmpR family regulator
VQLPAERVVTEEPQSPTDESSAATDATFPLSVLVVEDETHLADLYADYLRGEHEVRVAYGGEEALEMVDEAVDVVLLDRRMPVVNGNEVVAGIQDRDLECRIAMITAVNPDFDIIELGIDDYLVKPVSREDVISVVERLGTITEYNERVQRLTSKKLKRNVLEVEKTRAELDDSEQFQTLCEDIEDLKAEVEELADQLDPNDIDGYL